MLIKGQDVANIKPGDTLANDGHAHQVFDYMLSNPPFGVEWKQSEKAVRKEYEEQGFNGRFGPGLPRISDGSAAFYAASGEKDAPARPMAGHDSVSSRMVRRCLRAEQVRERAISGSISWKVTS